MRANCVICSDIFDEINQISAAPCGHVYHSSCLTVWVGQSKTCPQCRARVTIADIRKLFFNFVPSSNFSSSDLENEIVNLKAQLSAKDVELNACRKQKEETKAFVRKAEERASVLEQAMYQNEYELSDLRMKVKSLSKLESKVLKLEQRNVALENDLKLLNEVQTIVSGNMKDVEDILKAYTNHSEATKQLATYCACLKRELQKVIESKNKLVELNSKLKRENGLFAARVKFFEEALAISKNNSKFTENITPAKPNPFRPLENNLSSPDTPSTTRNQNVSSEEIGISPLSVPFKTKFNLCVKTKSNTEYKFDSMTQSEVKLSGMASVSCTMKRDDDNSIIRTGYNGLGGHSNYIASSGFKRTKSSFTSKRKN